MNNSSHLSTQFENSRFTSIALLLCILAPMAIMAIIIIVGQITPDYDPVSDTISLMGAREKPYSFILNTGYVIYGALICTAAYSLYKGVKHSSLTKTLVVLLIIHAFGSICLAIFPDKPGATGGFFTANIIHNTFSGISHVALLSGILVYSISNLRRKTARIIAIIGIAIVVINIIMPLINVFSPLKDIAGLSQRFFIFCSFSWVILTSTLLYRSVLSNQAKDSMDDIKTTSLASTPCCHCKRP